jgi:hypothetical protein
LTPETVSDAPPLVGALNLEMNVTAGASYVNDVMSVPAIEFELTATECALPMPAEGLQTMDVSVTSFTSEQASPPISTVGVPPSRPKFTPPRVRLVPAVEGIFGSVTSVTTGESYVRMQTV